MRRMMRLFITFPHCLSRRCMSCMRLVRLVSCTEGEIIPWWVWRLGYIMVFILSPLLQRVYWIGLRHNCWGNLLTHLLFSWNRWWSSHSQGMSRWLIMRLRMSCIREGRLMFNNRIWLQAKFLPLKLEDGSRNLEPWDWKWKWNFLTIKKSMESIPTSFFKTTDTSIITYPSHLVFFWIIYF